VVYSFSLSKLNLKYFFSLKEEAEFAVREFQRENLQIHKFQIQIIYYWFKHLSSEDIASFLLK